MSVIFKSYKPQVMSALQQKKARTLEILGGTAERHAVEQITRNRSVITGNLRDSITHQRLDENTELIGTNVFYAPYVELGTSRSRAKPYLRPAIENHRSEYQAIIKAELGGR